MSGFSQALIEDYSDQLDAEARVYLDQIIEASHKMSELIEGILVLSRSTRVQLERELIDLSAMVKEIISDLAEIEPGTQGQVASSNRSWKSTGTRKRSKS